MQTPRILALFVAATALTLSASQVSAQWSLAKGSFVVANRTSGDISVLRARDGKLLRTVAVRKDGKKGEPMYVSQAGREVLVGDRAHDRVVRFDKRTYRVLGEYKAGKGVFHQWADGRQLWVNNDVDNTTTVVDLRRRRVVKTIAMPADLVKDGFKNHDVWTAYGFAWITMLKAGNDGYVLLYSGRTFRLLRRQRVGADPHVWLDRWTGTLVIPAQNSSRVDFLHPLTLKVQSTLKLPGAHGVFSPLWSRALYVTNLPGGGKDDLFTIALGWRLSSKPSLKSTASTGTAVAHNIAATPDGSRIFVTHSGIRAREVTIFAPVGLPWAPRGVRKIATVKAGLNPFGIGYVR